MITIIGQEEGKTITHKHCGAVLRYHKVDVRNLWTGEDYGGGAAGADGFTCPQCGTDVIVRSW